MAGLFLVVLTNAVEGREDEFNEWYTGRHLDDVLALDGVRAAQRFEFTPSKLSRNPSHGYLALYEVDPDRREEAEAALLEASGTDAMPISDAMVGQRAWWFTSMTDRVEAPVPADQTTGS